MPKYQCPECEAVLKRETPVPEGKKIKCPKCEFVFLPAPQREAGAKSEPAKKGAKTAKPALPRDDDDEEGGSYGVASEPEEAGAKKKKKKEVNYGSLRDKFEKSKRGPAMAKLVKLSNGMLFIGVLTVIAGLVGMMAGLWPFIFSENSPTGAAARNNILSTLGSLAFGLYGACICYGGSKMHELDSYRWSMIAAIMCSIYGILTLIAGLLQLVQTATGDDDDGFLKMVMGLVSLAILAWGGFATNVGLKTVKRLKEEDVIEGYEETQEMIEY